MRLMERFLPVSPSATGNTLIESSKSDRAARRSNPAMKDFCKKSSISETKSAANFFRNAEYSFHFRNFHCHLLRAAAGANFAIRRFSDFKINDQFYVRVNKCRLADNFITVTQRKDMLGRSFYNGKN